MGPTRAAKKKLDEIQKVLSALKGVKYTFYLTKHMRTGLSRIERHYPSLGPLTVQNEGVLQCLKRQNVVCIVKDKTFRGPPHPTVVLVDGEGRVIGREVLRGEKVKKGPGSKTIFLGKDFVIFYGKGSGKGARFVLPPVSFKEVEKIHGTTRVISSSPSTAGDLFLRESAGLDDDPKLASILIGFDLP
jgi:hypothetical protein